MNLNSAKSTPFVKLPTRISAAGTASQVISGGTVRSLSCSAETAPSQLRVTVDGTTFDLLAGNGWEVSSPDGRRFINDFTLTALAGSFVISTIA